MFVHSAQGMDKHSGKFFSPESSASLSTLADQRTSEASFWVSTNSGQKWTQFQGKYQRILSWQETSPDRPLNRFVAHPTTACRFQNAHIVTFSHDLSSWTSLSTQDTARYCVSRQKCPVGSGTYAPGGRSPKRPCSSRCICARTRST